MARVTLNNETYNAATDGAEISGNTGTEQVNVFAGVTDLDIASNIERVDLPGDIADFTFSSFGNSVTVYDASGNVVAAISGADGKELVFGDGSVDVAFDSGTGTLTVGGETVGSTPAAITPAASEIDAGTTSETAGTGGGVTPPPTSGTDLSADQDDLDGTTGADTFDAPLSPAGTQTLQSFDRIDGLGGTDSLYATLPGPVSLVTDFGVANALSTAVQNVENFYLQSLSAQFINFIGVETVEQIWSDRSQDNLFLGSVENQVTFGAIEGEGSVFQTVYSAGVVDDGLDANDVFTQDVVLNNADIILDLNAAGPGFAPATGGVVLDFALTGDSSVDLIGNVTGFVDTVMTSGTGSLDLDLTAIAPVDLTAMFGGGDDTLALDGTSLTADDDIDMGAGDDTLALTGLNSDTLITALNISGVAGLENLTLVDAALLAGAATLDIEALGGVTFEGGVTGGQVLTVETTSPDLILGFEGATATTIETGEDVANLQLTVGTETTPIAGSFVVINAVDGNGDTESLQSIALVDANPDDTNAQTQSLILGDGTTELDGLTMIDISEAGQDDDTVTLSAAQAGFDGPVTIMVGETALAYTNDAAGLREVFQFVGEDINTATLSAFTATGAGNGDKLDFSMFASVTSLDDLSITGGSGSDFVIAAADDEFTGTITLTGTGALEQSTLEATAFIF